MRALLLLATLTLITIIAWFTPPQMGQAIGLIGIGVLAMAWCITTAKDLDDRFRESTDAKEISR